VAARGRMLRSRGDTAAVKLPLYHVIGSRPDGDTSPSSRSASARPPSCTTPPGFRSAGTGSKRTCRQGVNGPANINRSDAQHVHGCWPRHTQPHTPDARTCPGQGTDRMARTCGSSCIQATSRPPPCMSTTTSGSSGARRARALMRSDCRPGRSRLVRSAGQAGETAAGARQQPRQSTCQSTSTLVAARGQHKARTHA
jgi:hypothetical protein